MTEITEDIYDITIIGAGPSGLFAGFYAGMRKNKVQILDSLAIPGGQLTALYPEKTIHDVPGYFAVKAENLVADLVKQTAQFGVPVRLSEKVTDIVPTSHQGVYEVVTTKSRYLTKSVIIATGNGSFAPKTLQTDEVSEVDDAKILYRVTDKQQFTDKHVAIAGGGDSAIDMALMLADVAASVSLIHRRDAFRAHESSVDKLHASTVDVLTPVTIRKMVDHGTGLQVTLSDDRALEVDYMIVQHGFLSNNKDIRSWSIDLEMKRQHFIVDAHYQTNCENIYAIGDTANYDGKLGLIVEGFKEGPHAINQIMSKLNPGKLKHAHSTSLF